MPDMSVDNVLQALQQPQPQGLTPANLPYMTTEQWNQIKDVGGALAGYTPFPDIYQHASNLWQGKGDPGMEMVGAALGVGGLAAPGGAGRRAAEEVAPPLYSAVSKAVEGAKLDKAPLDQWLGYLRNQPGVKEEELNWLGLGQKPVGQAPDFQQGVIPKQQMQDWVNAHGVKLNEVEKYNPEELKTRFNTIGERMDAMRQGATTKFSQWQLPGGENYKEMLLQLPPKQQVPEISVTPSASGSGWSVYTDGRRTGAIGGGANLTEEQALAIARSGNTQNYVQREANYDPASTFQSSHWDEPNVLAHVRFNDRTLPPTEEGGDPRKALFLEELQSDWHQQGRSKGYKFDTDQRLEDLTQEYGALNDVAAKGDVDAQRKALARQADIVTEMNRLHDINQAGVPDAPFKTTWPDLALKRMVRHAAENDYDALAWTPGDVQADRYDLSKQVSKIEYHPENQDLHAYDLNGKNVIAQTGVTPDKLPDYIGKDAADKLLNNPTSISGGKSTLGGTGYVKSGWHELSGIDLKVGGEGMRAFYDKMLVDKANAIGKKYGAKVGQESIDAGDYKVNRDSYDPPFRLEKRNNPDIISRHATADEAWAEAERLGGQKVHVLPITPELKRAALTKGFPMFSAGGAVVGQAMGQQQNMDNENVQNTIKALQGQ